MERGTEASRTLAGARREAIDAACAIGDDLRRTALRHAGECTWLGRDVGDDHLDLSRFAATTQTLGGDMYQGTSGVALFLTELERLRPGAGDPSTIVAALTFARRSIRAVPADDLGGFFTGLAGVGYACVRAGEVLGDRAQTLAGVALIREGLALCRSAAALDLMSGVAGVVLASAARSKDHHVLADVVTEGATALLNASVAEGAAFRWNLRRPGRDAEPSLLTGVSHGLSGIAAALFAAYSATGERRLLSAARGALLTEDRWFVKERGNWCDLRDDGDASPPKTVAARQALPCETTWCHGAPGIAAVRTTAAKALGAKSAPLRALAPALKTTEHAISAWRPSHDVTLCHGVLGLLECQWLAGGRPSHPSMVRHILRVVRAHAAGGDWPSGVPSRGKNPSLMVGTAGVGHQLLRWGSGGLVPSILVPAADHFVQ